MSVLSRLASLRDPRLLRFLAVGAVNFAFGYSFLALLLVFNFSNHMALLFATVVGVLFNFKSTGTLVFKSRTNSLLFRFIGAYCVIYVTNLLLVWALIWMGVDRFWAFGLLAVPMALFGFYLHRSFVFAQRPVRTE